MKAYFILRQGGTGMELARHQANLDEGNFTEQMIRWLQFEHIVLLGGDTIVIEEIE